MTSETSMAPAIEGVVIDEIYERIERLIRFDGEAPAPWLIRLVVEHFQTNTRLCNITPGYVSGLIWMLANDGELNIDKHGMVQIAPATTV